MRHTNGYFSKYIALASSVDNGMRLKRLNPIHLMYSTAADWRFISECWPWSYVTSVNVTIRANALRTSHWEHAIIRPQQIWQHIESPGLQGQLGNYQRLSNRVFRDLIRLNSEIKEIAASSNSLNCQLLIITIIFFRDQISELCKQVRKQAIYTYSVGWIDVTESVAVAPPGFSNRGEVRYGSIGGLDYTKSPRSWHIYCSA